LFSSQLATRTRRDYSPTVSNEDAAKKFPGFKQIKPYLRFTSLDAPVTLESTLESGMETLLKQLHRIESREVIEQWEQSDLVKSHSETDMVTTQQNETTKNLLPNFMEVIVKDSMTKIPNSIAHINQTITETASHTSTTAKKTDFVDHLLVPFLVVVTNCRT
jgi:hypothetical protein